jgi:hypothetical protein
MLLINQFFNTFSNSLSFSILSFKIFVPSYDRMLEPHEIPGYDELIKKVRCIHWKDVGQNPFSESISNETKIDNK